MKKQDRIIMSNFKKLSKTFPSIVPVDGTQPIEKGWTKHCYEPRDFSSRDFKGLNAGLPTGPSNRIIVVEIHDADVFEGLMMENGWQLPESFTVSSGDGALHIFYRYPIDGKTYGCHRFRDPADVTKTAFNIKGIGGMVIAPGSIHPDTGRQYKVIIKSPIAAAPDWLLRLCVKKTNPLIPDVVKPAKPKILAKILLKLKGVESTGPNRWIALCPAHNDKKRSLSISLAEDGKIILHCGARCRAKDIIHALGLSNPDLLDQSAFKSQAIEKI